MSNIHDELANNNEACRRLLGLTDASVPRKVTENIFMCCWKVDDACFISLASFFFALGLQLYAYFCGGLRKVVGCQCQCNLRAVHINICSPIFTNMNTNCPDLLVKIKQHIINLGFAQSGTLDI